MAESGKNSKRTGRLAPADRAAVAALARLFDAARPPPCQEGHPFATAIVPAMQADGTIAGLPWTDYDAPIARFWRMVHRLKFTDRELDWPVWLSEFRASVADPLDPELVAGLSPQDLRHYLTALERAERFADGTWRAALERGIFEAVLQRILDLQSSGDSLEHKGLP